MYGNSLVMIYTVIALSYSQHKLGILLNIIVIMIKSFYSHFALSGYPVSKYHHDSTLRAAMTIFVVESPVAFMQMFYSWDFSSISCNTYREAIGKTRLV